MADVYIGYATNVTFGTTQNVALVPKSVFNQAGGAAHYQTVYAENTDCALVLEKGTSIGQSFATMFAYPQVHIEEVLIPNLESIIKEQLLVNVTQGQLDSMLLEVQNNEDTVFYVSYWPQTSEHFGKINTDPSLKVYKSMYGDSTSYTDGPSYRMICHDNYTNSDTIATLSQWITDWKYQIGRNEYQKMQAIQDENALIQNYSFHAASPIEYRESYSTGKEHE